jgi:hypothetical protein
MHMKTVIIAAACASLAAPALAGYNFAATSGPAPTYSTTLTFDEPGGPTGAGLPIDSWSASYGVSVLQAGVGPGNVLNLSTEPGFGWLPNNNIFYAPFGVFMTFENDLTEFSAQVWDNAGPATFIGGGQFIGLYNDGVEVATFFVNNPAFGGVGSPWYNITTDGGSVFDEVRFVGNTFGFPETFMDSVSWNAVPAPGALAAAGLAGLLVSRRRR